MTRIFKVSLIYFGVVFGIGFILGTIRVPFIVPALGERTAEIIELPFMLGAVYFAARCITYRYALWSDLTVAFAIGALSALFLLLIEFSVVLWLRGFTVREFLESRDPVAAALYYAAVGLFALMPGLLALWKRNTLG